MPTQLQASRYLSEPKPHDQCYNQSFVKELAKPAQVAHRALGFAAPQKTK